MVPQSLKAPGRKTCFRPWFPPILGHRGRILGRAPFHHHRATSWAWTQRRTHRGPALRGLQVSEEDGPQQQSRLTGQLRSGAGAPGQGKESPAQAGREHCRPHEEGRRSTSHRQETAGTVQVEGTPASRSPGPLGLWRGSTAVPPGAVTQRL